MKGTKIILSDVTLDQMLSIPSEGTIANRLANQKVSLRYILNRLDIEEIGEFMSNTLSTNMRLLHHIIGRIFLPKNGRFDFISKRVGCDQCII